jgi:antitoxin (DNA-binding transcriptional repressor) of toxin-antitoxin stability system
MDRKICVADALKRFSEVLEFIRTGNEVTLTQDGEEVARLAPPTRQTARQAVLEWREARRGVRLSPGSTIRELIDEGRK